MRNSISAADLDIHVEAGDEQELFKWLVASFLMGKRIQSEIAAGAYRVIVQLHQFDTPRKLADCTHRGLVRMLGEAKYTRYDESTADRLLKLGKKLNEEYAGKVINIRAASEHRADFEKRLKAFEGIGPKTIEIFMSEAQAVLF